MIIITKRYTDPQLIAERIKVLRKERQIATQQELADQLHFSVSTIKQYESGRRVPERENLKRIAEFFNVSEAYLLGDTEFKSVFEEIDSKLGEGGLDNLRFNVELVRRFNKSFDVDITVIPPKEQKKLDKEIREFISFKLSKYKFEVCTLCNGIIIFLKNHYIW